MLERTRHWQIATILPLLLLGLFFASAAGAAPSDQGTVGVSTATATPTGTPTLLGGTPTATTTPLAPGAATTSLATVAVTPAGTGTPTIPGPTNLLVQSSGPQPGTYTLSWTAPAGMTVRENRVQTVPASGTPEVLARTAGNQNNVVMRVDPRIGYAVVVVAVDLNNRVSGPSNVVNTAGAPTATPITPPPTPSGMAPSGYGAVPGAAGTGPYTGTSPYTGAYGAAPYGGAYGRYPYSGVSPTGPYGGAPSPYSAPGYGAPYNPATSYPGSGATGAAQWWCTPLSGTTVVPLGQTRPVSGYTNCTYHP